MKYALVDGGPERLELELIGNVVTVILDGKLLGGMTTQEFKEGKIFSLPGGDTLELQSMSYSEGTAYKIRFNGRDIPGSGFHSAEQLWAVPALLVGAGLVQLCFFVRGRIEGIQNSRYVVGLAFILLGIQFIRSKSGAILRLAIIALLVDVIFSLRDMWIAGVSDHAFVTAALGICCLVTCIAMFSHLRDFQRRTHDPPTSRA